MSVTVVVAGLDMDYLAHSFEIVKELMPKADYLYKHHAVCKRCGTDAWVSHRKVNVNDRLLLGAEGEYEPLCRSCYKKAIEEDEINLNQEKFYNRIYCDYFFLYKILRNNINIYQFLIGF